MSGQISLFDSTKKFVIHKPIRLIELNGLEIIVSSNGEIKSKDKNNIRKNGKIDNRKGKLIKPSLDKDGYLRVTFSNNGDRKSYYVHRLIAMAFLDSYSDQLQVNHKNGIKTDNNYKNLEMVTNKENILHSILLGLKPKLKRDKLGRFCGKEVM